MPRVLERYDDVLGPPTRVGLGDGLSMAVTTAGPPDGPPLVLLHGEPTWSYLWRDVIAPLAARGHRVYAPDLVGFGRSDKPRAVEAHSYTGHVAWVSQALDALGLHRDVALACQDWGGLIGLRLVGEQPERFRAVVAANTALPMGTPPPPPFYAWRAYARWRGERLRPSDVVSIGTVRHLSPAAREAYDAPFPTAQDLAGPRAMPNLVPGRWRSDEARACRRAWRGLRRFDRPFTTAFSNCDPVTAGAGAQLRWLVPGARGRSHVTIRGAGHFLQEDAPALLAAAIDAGCSTP